MKSIAAGGPAQIRSFGDRTVRILSRFAWVLVAGVALALSNWSLAFVAMHWHVVEPLAWLVSVALDGTAVICARISLDAARRGDSGLAATVTVMTFALFSAYFNSLHAQLAGDPWEARVFFALPPVAALVVLELSIRAYRRDALRAAGRIADPLPAMGAATWLNLPRSTYRGMRNLLEARQSAKLRAAIVSARIDQERADAALAVESAKAQALISSALQDVASLNAALDGESAFSRAGNKADRIAAARLALGSEASAADVRAWLSERGESVSTSYVRTIDSRTPADLRDSPPQKRNSPLQIEAGSATPDQAPATAMPGSVTPEAA